MHLATRRRFQGPGGFTTISSLRARISVSFAVVVRRCWCCGHMEDRVGLRHAGRVERRLGLGQPRASGWLRRLGTAADDRRLAHQRGRAHPHGGCRDQGDAHVRLRRALVRDLQPLCICPQGRLPKWCELLVLPLMRPGREEEEEKGTTRISEVDDCHMVVGPMQLAASCAESTSRLEGHFARCLHNATCAYLRLGFVPLACLCEVVRDSAADSFRVVLVAHGHNY
mmetsp:Transcript_116692/g.302406  ORF Transcript_116692/g.302406 Transcript_116692/m.302406 type:complete len:226 (-) Transcript_116692:513-1190(-)